MKAETVQGGQTTGIGSLPHHNIDAALEYAFRYDIPFLPQIPLRNPWEFSVPQGLDGLPGIRVEKDGSALLDTSVWVGRAKAFDEKLQHAFELAADSSAFEAFEPSAATSSSWQPFLWELQERETRVAKIQTVGPLTAQWTLRSTENASLDRMPSSGDISGQVFRLVLARALGMSRRLKSLGVTPLLFLDEPALFVLNPQNPVHLLGLQQLKLLVQTLQKESVTVGIHCCSNTQWDVVAGLGIDVLSFDVRLSLESVLSNAEWVKNYVAGGGRFGFGTVPTSEGDVEQGRSLKRAVSRQLKECVPSISEQVFTEALWTPACGLALNSPSDAEMIKRELDFDRMPT